MADIDKLFEENEKKAFKDQQSAEIKSAQSPKSDDGATTAALRGAIEGSTLGLGKYVSAAAQKTGIPQAMMEGIFGSSDPNLSRLDAMKAAYNAPTQSFADALAAEKAANKQASANNPVAYTVGSLAGSLPQAGNIVNVARGAAPILGKKALGGAVSGAATGGLYGGTQGALGADTLADVPKEAALGGTLGAAGGALGGAAAGANVVRSPEVAGALSKPVSQYLDDAVNSLKNSDPVTRFLVGGGGLVGGGLKARDVDWQTDPLSAAGETAKHAALGALGGQAAARLPAVPAMLLDATKRLPGRVADFGKGVFNEMSHLAQVPASKVGTAAGNTAQMSVGNVATAPFTTLRDYLYRKDTEPVSPEVAAEADWYANTPGDPRKKAMELQSRPAGRAVSNSESPINTK